MRGVNEIVREGEGHVFALVQLLGGDDAVLLTAEIPGEAVNRDLTCTDRRRAAGQEQHTLNALGKNILPSKEAKIVPFRLQAKTDSTSILCLRRLLRHKIIVL